MHASLHFRLPTYLRVYRPGNKGKVSETNVEPGMSRIYFLHFGMGTGKPRKLSQCLGRAPEIQKKTFLQFGTGTGNTRNHSRSSGRAQEIQETIPIVWDTNGKTQNSR